MPMWMHAGVSPTTFGPNTASATAGAVTVTATARVTGIRWAMGDGTTVSCPGPGALYKPSYGKRTSPDCGHAYTHTSADQSGSKYTVSATSQWQVDWVGAGQHGQFTMERTSQVRVSVGELQALG
ncbi:ATP/GTP-binding protein [Streptomyces noursei]|nr:ATP/GTP-binding protein [Streptomyces noursei]